MYVKVLAKDNHPGPNIEILNPSINEIVESVLKLDGDKSSYVMLSPSKDSEEMMVIGGGENKKYICFYYDGDEYSLTNPNEKSDERVEVFMGQTSVRKKKEFIDIDKVLTAVKTYAENGKMDESLEWIEI